MDRHFDESGHNLIQRTEKQEIRIKNINRLAWVVILGVAVSGCSGLGGKAVERKVKKAMPGAQTLDEKAVKKVDQAGENVPSKMNR